VKTVLRCDDCEKAGARPLGGFAAFDGLPLETRAKLLCPRCRRRFRARLKQKAAA
jgi:hypothetical protein